MTEPEPQGEPTAQDTATMPPVSVGDPSWDVLLVAALVSFAFLAGVMLGRSGGRHPGYLPPPSAATTAPAAASAQQPPTQAAVLPATAGMPDGYYMGASTSQERPAQPSLALSASATKIYYHYSLPGWPANTPMGFRWWLRGKLLPSDSAVWRPSKNAAWAQGCFELHPPRGAAAFAAGIYEVELSGPNDLREVGSFAVVEGLEGMMAQEAPPGGILVGRPVICLEVDGQGRPKAAVTQVPPSVRKLYACFIYDGAVPGTVLTVRWFHEDVEIETGRSELRLPAAAGQAYGTLQVDKGPLPVGNWRVAVYLGATEKPMAEAAFAVTEKAIAPAAGGSVAPAAPHAPPVGRSRAPAHSPAR